MNVVATGLDQRRKKTEASRAPSLDAARFVLIVLVVLGHLLELVRAGSADLIYRFIYLFHMPAFIFLSGMVSRDTLDVAYARRLLLSVAGVYLLHQCLLQWTDAELFNHSFSLKASVPYWALWYLMSLLWWRIALPFLLATRRPLLAACVVSLLAGIMPFAGYEWSLSRTLVFLPFFVAGYQWSALRGRRLPSLSPWMGFALLALLALAAWSTRGFSLKWYYGSVGYAAWNVGVLQGLGYRAMYLGFAAVGVAGVLVVCSRLGGGIFGLGRYSIGAYISHLYLVKAAVALGWLGWLWGCPEPLRLLILLVISLLVVIAGSLLARAIPWLFDLGPVTRRMEAILSRKSTKDVQGTP